MQFYGPERTSGRGQGRQFQERGRGRGSGRGRGVCRLFSSNGRCRFGDSCKFEHIGPQAPPQSPGARPKRGSLGDSGSLGRPRYGPHGLQTPENSPQTTPRPRRTRTEGQNSCFEWKSAVKRSNSSIPTRLQALLTQAIDMIESDDAEVKQATIKFLGETNQALEWIKNIVESEYIIAQGRYNVTSYSFYQHCVPFLKLVSHEEIISSLVLEKAVGTIYNVIYGPHGRRGITFFNHVCNNLVSLSRGLKDNVARAEFEKAISAAIAALYHTISLNQEALIEQQFKTIVTTFETCIKTYNNKDEYFIRLAERDIHKIKEILHMGESIPQIPIERIRRTTEFVEFEFVDLPGNLSTNGPRHDNDHTKIEKISILPTTDEIKSNRPEFLPLKRKAAKHHEEGIYRLLDSQFRLLREDTAGQLRDAVRGLVRKWDVIVQEKNMAARSKALRHFDAKMSIFEGIKVERLKPDRRKGMVIDISFLQPQKCSNMDRTHRNEWWKDSRCLATGSLVALVDHTLETSFLLVVGREELSQHRGPSSTNGIYDLASNKYRAMISLQLVHATSLSDQERIRNLARKQTPADAILVEFPGLLFASFEPILKCLQKLHENPNLPFTEWLAPTQNTAYGSTNGTVHVPQPLYLTRKEGVELNLSCIMKKGVAAANRRHSVKNPISIEKLQANTTLDRGQCESLLLGLQSELALIQGPPGTGKSYVGVQLAKILLANWKNLKIGPIICVCYTNHALDQFLEHIFDSGEKKIIRLGSRSKSEKIQDLTLANIRAKMNKTSTERGNIYECHHKLEEIETDMVEEFTNISKPFDVPDYLEKNYPELHDSLFQKQGLDEDGFEVVTKKRTNDQIYRLWLNGRPRPGGIRRPPTRTVRKLEELEKYNGDLWILSTLERMRLSVYWERLANEAQAEKLQGLMERFQKANQDLKVQYNETDMRCLKQARVIGVTTTGLASNSDMLRSLPTKVLLIEEAAEVLEAHTITALLPSVEHAILIGDHLQLRAQINKHDLSMESKEGQKYGLDESLFERLTKESFDGAKMPIATMDVQRRMHPSISRLIRKTLYPKLKNYVSTKGHPEVFGMRRRLFWLDHGNHEDSGSNSREGVIQTSKSNEWEANLVVSLVRHLIRQSVYGKDDIAVLTPYLGQLRILRKKFMNTFDLIMGDKDLKNVEEEDEFQTPAPQLLTHTKTHTLQQVHQGKLIDGLRLATVDNFQGEEAKVIILSLVRSNEELKCGFLKTPNRINVALSRARNGMYIIGNAETASPVEMWSNVISMLEEGGNIGSQLELMCPRHRETKIFASQPEDFVRLSPEGGCSLQCGKRLGCGHTCIFKCHSDALHEAVKCLEDCVRQFKNCSHPCPKRCWQDCGKCVVKITSGIRLPCGHRPPYLYCHETYDLTKVQCRHEVTRIVPGCNHEVKVPCYTDMEKHMCKSRCGSTLPCGHECQKECSSCRKKQKKGSENNEPQVPETSKSANVIVDHGNCTTPCGRSYTTCNHACQKICHGDAPCGPCSRPCEVFCSHSKCNRRCDEPCAPCIEKCAWSCRHRGSCNMPCAVPCDLIPCNKRCEKLLTCGHPCPSICGEACPSPEFCQICASAEILGKTVDLVMMSEFGEVDLDEDPVIVLDCGHLFTVSTLDGHMAIRDTYDVDENGIIIEPKCFVSPEMEMKNCPECRSPLRNIHRYNRVVKVALLNEATKRFMAHSATNFTELIQLVSKHEATLEDMVEQFTNKRLTSFASISTKLPNFKNTAAGFMSIIQGFLDSTAEQEQPYGKVQAMVVNERLRRGTISKFELDNTIIQHGFCLRGHSLRLRLLWAILWNFVTMIKSLPEIDVKKEWKDWVLPHLADAKIKCIDLRDRAGYANLLKEGIEAQIYHAQFFSLELTQQPSQINPEDRTRATNHEIEALDACLQRLTASTQVLRDDIEKAKRLLNGGTFYSFVQTEEKRQIYEAMAREFSGTGHWYYCQNNHPFTIGECGMPMEQALCPECDAPVGGQSHTVAAGVTHATDIETLMGGVRL